MLRGIVTLLFILLLVPLNAGCSGEGGKKADPAKAEKGDSNLGADKPLPPPPPLK